MLEVLSADFRWSDAAGGFFGTLVDSVHRSDNLKGRAIALPLSIATPSRVGDAAWVAFPASFRAFRAMESNN
ncbi:MAG: hypothetical protein AB1861_04510 [Cyanobacteriota bacterium]